MRRSLPPALKGWLRSMVVRHQPRFVGAFPSRAAAVAAVPASLRVGYDHDEVVDISLSVMSTIVSWDYPVLFWLSKSQPATILDVGGHVGTKYRAFRNVLDLGNVDWTVYDLPALVRAGQARAAADGLSIAFIDDLAAARPAELMLASGVLQYIDIEFAELIARLPTPPTHIILNKVAVWDKLEMFTLENFYGKSQVPYRIRNRILFEAEIESTGYTIEDCWDLPDMRYEINTHRAHGHWLSLGYKLRKKLGR